MVLLLLLVRLVLLLLHWAVPVPVPVSQPSLPHLHLHLHLHLYLLRHYLQQPQRRLVESRRSLDPPTPRYQHEPHNASSQTQPQPWLELWLQLLWQWRGAAGRIPSSSSSWGAEQWSEAEAAAEAGGRSSGVLAPHAP